MKIEASSRQIIEALMRSPEPIRWVFAGDSITHRTCTRLDGVTTPNSSRNVSGGSFNGCATWSSRPASADGGFRI